ncbi:hypothetical protein BT69DRAFT_1285789, partial [Atractiella rhizophila]
IQPISASNSSEIEDQAPKENGGEGEQGRRRMKKSDAMMRSNPEIHPQEEIAKSQVTSITRFIGGASTSKSSKPVAISDESECSDEDPILQPDTNLSRPFLKRSTRLKTVQEELFPPIHRTLETTVSWGQYPKHKLSKSQRKSLAMHTAIRIESDLYWFSSSEGRYQERLGEEKKKIKSWKGCENKVPYKWFMVSQKTKR